MNCINTLSVVVRARIAVGNFIIVRPLRHDTLRKIRAGTVSFAYHVRLNDCFQFLKICFLCRKKLRNRVL